MPAPLDVDREAVKAHALTHGVREAARAFNLSEDTVKQWSRRFGWLAAAGVATVAQPLPASIAPRAVPNVPKPSQAARYSVDNLKSRSRYRLMKGVDKGALAISRWKGDAIAANAQQLNQLASAHAKLCPPEQGAGTPMLSLTFLSQPVEHSVTAQVIDVEH